MRPNIITASAVLLLLFAVCGFLYKREYDARLTERATASERIRQDSVKLADLTKQLVTARARHAIADMTAKSAMALYDDARAHPSVRKVVLPGETDTVVVVRTEYVAAADSVREACAILQLECLRYRLAADSTIAAQERIIADLKMVDRKKGGFTLPTLLLGAVLGVAAVEAVR